MNLEASVELLLQLELIDELKKSKNLCINLQPNQKPY